MTTSTRINSSSVHTYICVCFIRNYIPIPFSNGLLTNNSTWCQNRGCICISSVRRTYGRIHAVSCIHPSILNVQILQDRISKEEEREDPRRELQSSFQLESKSVSSVSTCNPAFYKNYPVILCKENYSTYRINSSTRNLQEILQLQGSSCAHR